MRKSRVLLAGVAVAAAGVATSAFTASNDVHRTTASPVTVRCAVTGATVTNIALRRRPRTTAKLDAVDVHDDDGRHRLTHQTVILTLTTAAAPSVGSSRLHVLDA